MYDNGQPFLFEGKVVVKTGPQEYDVYEGSVTSCQLPHPDWQLFAGKFSVTSEKATAHNTVFRVMDVPLVYLPYVTHPVGGDERQSGFMIPVIGQSSTKGLVLGEQIYVVLSRSADMTVGAEYFSKRGWQQSATFRYRGLGNNFALAHYSGLLDRGYVTGGQYVNQGGEDVVFSGRYDLSQQTRLVADMEYLSSYAYREAFTENFNQAVSSDILSVGYAVHQVEWLFVVAVGRPISGTEASGYTDTLRAADTHLSCAVAGTGNDRAQAWKYCAFVECAEHCDGAEASAAELSTTGLTERFDLRPEISLPMKAGGWRFRSSVAARETIYSRSRENGTQLPPVESGEAVNRADVEVGVEARAPVLERTFTGTDGREVIRYGCREAHDRASGCIPARARGG